MRTLTDPSTVLLAACGGDTVKLFDVSGDPCTLSYTPSPGCIVNTLKWNHTNLVVASAGEDKKISLWHKNGKSLGTIPVEGTDIQESISAINFSNKGSRYICSGGSGQVVRIWDLQRKRCIKWLRGHTNTITAAMFNCKDEHLASISLNGHLMLHNFASGDRAAELKDPNQQVLRVLDYSRFSRHLLVTAGDDGTVHLWDTTGRNPKMSWLKQHSAPTAGISFSPASDKMIASVGLDKKLYTYDSGSRKHAFFSSYEAPLSSLAFRDDGLVLAAGTSNGRVVFYDVRGKPQPFTVLRAYGSSEAVTSLCWQRSKPVIVNETTCSAETALLGNAVEDSILMPDPLPSMTSLTLSMTSSSIAEETPQKAHLWPGGSLSRLHAPRNFKDDMEVFSPLVDVQPITPSLDKLWNNNEPGIKNDHLPVIDKKPSSILFPSSRRFPFTEDGANDHLIFNWKDSSASKQDDTRTSSSFLGSTPSPSLKSEASSITPPEAWGGEKLLSDKLRQPLNLPSHFGMSISVGTSGSMFQSSSGLSSSTNSNLGYLNMRNKDATSGLSSSTNSNLGYLNMRNKDANLSSETPIVFPEHLSSSSLSLSKGISGSGNVDLPGPGSLTLPRRFPGYAERISTTSSFSEGTSLAVGSPKTKKTGSEARGEALNSFLSRSETLAATEHGNFPTTNGGILQPKGPQSDLQQGSSFTLQLFQRTLEETLDSFQKTIHEDVRNLHIEILRQFHMQEMEMSSVMSSVLENQAELIKEVKSLRQENERLRQLL